MQGGHMMALWPLPENKSHFAAILFAAFLLAVGGSLPLPGPVCRDICDGRYVSQTHLTASGPSEVRLETTSFPCCPDSVYFHIFSMAALTPIFFPDIFLFRPG